jgi:hypothetical protein
LEELTATTDIWVRLSSLTLILKAMKMKMWLGTGIGALIYKKELGSLVLFK